MTWHNVEDHQIDLDNLPQLPTGFSWEMRYMEKFVDGTHTMWVYNLLLHYEGDELASCSVGEVDSYLEDLHTLEIYQDLAQECMVTFLAYRTWWLETEALYTGYLNLKHNLITGTEDELFWDAVVQRWESAREFRSLHNNAEDWWGLSSTRGRIQGDVADKLDAANMFKGMKVETDGRSESEENGGETTA